MDLLFLAHRAPFAPDRGDRIRAYHILRHLAARVRVHLVAFADDPRNLTPPPALAAMLASCTVVPRRKSSARAAAEALATGRPVSLTAFADPALAAAVAQVRSRQPVARTYVFSGQMAQYLADTGRSVMDFVDLDSAKFAAYGLGLGPRAWMMRREARLLGAFERHVAGRVDASLFVSAAEAALFDVGAGRVVAVENGIDTVLFDPAARFEPVVEAAPPIVFTGQMDYRPNIEAVTWFADEILPTIRQRHAGARFAVVGRAPTPAVRALARRDGITVTGEVADVRGWLAAAAVVVAPLKLARGIQNKVLEAMAMARPVVASDAAAAGIDHRGTIRVGADAEAIAEAVCALLDDPADADALGHAARSRAIARYGWAARLAPLDALLGLPALDQAA